MDDFKSRDPTFHLQRALPTETQVASGTTQSKSGNSVNSSDSGIPQPRDPTILQIHTFCPLQNVNGHLHSKLGFRSFKKESEILQCTFEGKTNAHDHLHSKRVQVSGCMGLKPRDPTMPYMHFQNKTVRHASMSTISCQRERASERASERKRGR